MPPIIIFFGITSLLADIAGEMLFPILPLYFTIEFGLSVALFGIIEGFAEGFASLIQVWSGWISDRIRRKKFFVIFGYFTAAFGKFLLATAGTWPLILIARLFDRGGKGIRTSPRDALIADSIAPEQQGVAFGFHRTMDSAGAIIGNSLAIVFLALNFNLRSIVWISLIPAFLAIIFILPVNEPILINKISKKITLPSLKDFTTDRKKFGPEFWRFVWISIIFHLGKISYAFLLLRLSAFNIPTPYIPFFYLLFNIIQTVISLPIGKLADVFGKAILVFMSFILLCGSAIGFVIGGDLMFFLLLFVLYGTSFAFMEVGFRAFLVELSPPDLKATGLGIYFTVTGFAVMIASWIGGMLWIFGNGSMTFIYSAVMTGIASFLFLFFFRKRIAGAFTRLFTPAL